MVEIKYLQPPREGPERGQRPPLLLLWRQEKGGQKNGRQGEMSHLPTAPVPTGAVGQGGEKPPDAPTLSPLPHHSWPTATNQPPDIRDPSLQSSDLALLKNPENITTPSWHLRPAQPRPLSSLFSRCSLRGTLP